MNKAITRFLLATTCISIFSGCITHDETVVRDVERAKIEFANETAARIFYEALSKSPTSHSRKESTTEVDIPVVFDHKRHVITGPNAEFNEAVLFCDSNKDGKITEVEAKIFAEQNHKR